MSKQMSFDSGGGESLAVLGEDLGLFLSILTAPVRVPLSTGLSEREMALGVLAGLGLVEMIVLGHAVQHGKPLLGILMVALLMAKAVFGARNLTGKAPTWSYAIHRCQVCNLEFEHLLEAGPPPETCPTASCKRSYARGEACDGSPLPARGKFPSP